MEGALTPYMTLENNESQSYMLKESSKLLSFESDNCCLCIPIGCNSVRTFGIANRNTDTTLISLKRQSVTAHIGSQGGVGEIKAGQKRIA